MNQKINTIQTWMQKLSLFALTFLMLNIPAFSQDSTTTTEAHVVAKPAKNTFESIWIIDNQTVMVPIKGTFEMDILHRFGIIKNGYEDLAGLFAPSNIRLGFEYVPINNLMLGFSITKANMTWEGYAKYALLKQTKGKYPVSVTYFGDISIDSRDKDNFIHSSDRLMYFNQLIIARKITDNFSLQLAPSQTHVNVVDGDYDSGKLLGSMNHNHFALGVSGRYKIKSAMAVIVNYDQPLTQHRKNNPQPNLSLGIEFTTSSHAFQMFLGNYNSITPQRNNYFNKNDFSDFQQYLIGFNITRLFNF